eukprot:g65136.t1
MLTIPSSWNSRRQTTVALSTMDAEVIALSNATRTAIAVQSFLNELGIPITRPTVIHEDNRGSIVYKSIVKLADIDYDVQGLTDSSEFAWLILHVLVRAARLGFQVLTLALRDVLRFTTSVTICDFYIRSDIQFRGGVNIVLLIQPEPKSVYYNTMYFCLI